MERYNRLFEDEGKFIGNVEITKVEYAGNGKNEISYLIKDGKLKGKQDSLIQVDTVRTKKGDKGKLMQVDSWYWIDYGRKGFDKLDPAWGGFSGR